MPFLPATKLPLLTLAIVLVIAPVLLPGKFELSILTLIGISAIGAADLGFLTSVYFLVFAAAQLPFGILLDRHGPTIIQSALLLPASAGALVFALADSLLALVLGRALIGLGVALALMAGFKAIVLWFPAERLALVNGWFVMLGDRVRRVGIKTERVLACTLSLSMVAQLALVLGWPVPSCMAWSAVAAAGAATVLSYAILGEYFPKEASGRANAALNLLHVGAAFALQSFTGLVIEQWPVAAERYPAAAHQSAMGLIVPLQLVALAWFMLAARRRLSAPALRRLVRSLDGVRDPRRAFDLTNFRDVLEGKSVPVKPHPVGAWRAAAAGSALVCLVLLLCLALASGPTSIAAHVIEVAR